MATNIEKITEEVFNVLKGYGEKLTLFNQQGTKVFKPIEATKIYCQNSGTMLSIDDYGVNSTLSVSISGNTDVTQFKPIIQTLKKLAIKYNVLFDLKKFNKELKPKDFMFDLKEAFGDSKYIEFSKDYYEKLYGNPEDYDEIEYKNEVLGFAKIIENILAGKLKYNKRTTDLNPTIVDKLTYFSNNKTKIDNRLFKNFVKSVAAKTLNNRALTNFEKLFSEKLITIYDNEILTKNKPLDEENIFENWFNEKYIVNENYKLIKQDEHGKNIVYESGDYYIAVDSVDNCKYVTLWYKDKKVGYLLLTEGRTSDTRGYLTVYNVQVDPKHRNKGFGKKLYEIALQFISKQYKGIGGENEQRSNKKQVPSIYKSLGGTQHKSGDYTVDKLNESEEIPETINVGGKQRPSRNSKNQLIHQTIEGITNFWKWFGDSKAINGQGKPLVVYHGTGSDIKTFKGMVWASADTELPSDYAAMREQLNKGQANLMPLYMRIEQPFNADMGIPKTVTAGQFLSAVIESAVEINGQLAKNIEDELRWLMDIVHKARIREESGPHYGRHDFWNNTKAMFGQDGTEAIQKIFQILGFDGVMMKEDGEQTYGVFSPTQIKSAIGNKGTFSLNSKTITESEEIPETIGVDGRVYPTRNSKGEYIANTEQAIVNFYKWFDDSKMVDSQGRPIVMYHGTDYEFEDFDESHLGKNHGSVSKIGFWFTDDEQYAKNHGSNIKTAYLKAYTPKVVKSVNSIKSSVKQQYDSIIQHPSKEKLGRFEVDNAGIYCVFDKNKIKSIKTLNETITESTDIKTNDTIQISYNNNLYTVGYVGKKENYVYVKTKSNKVKKIPADKFVLVTNFSEKPSITIGGDMSDNIIKKITENR